MPTLDYYLGIHDICSQEILDSGGNSGTLVQEALPPVPVNEASSLLRRERRRDLPSVVALFYSANKKNSPDFGYKQHSTQAGERCGQTTLCQRTAQLQLCDTAAPSKHVCTPANEPELVDVRGPAVRYV